MKCTKVFLIILFTALTGCTTIQTLLPKKVTPAATTDYTSASNLPLEVYPTWQILDLPEYPTAQVCVDNNIQYACFTKQNFFTLIQLKDMSKGNQKMLKQIDALYRANIEERNNILKITQDYEGKVNLLQKDIANKDAEIKNNKRDYFVKTWTERIIFVILLYFKI